MEDWPLWLFLSAKFDIYFLQDTTGVYRVLPESAGHFKSPDKKIKFIASSLDIDLVFIQLFGGNELKSIIAKRVAEQLIGVAIESSRCSL
ncbi:MAG: hypothetical protein IJ196_04740 [Prevotella sp.]|nr:hypothetical protein [Prevotella sp.]